MCKIDRKLSQETSEMLKAITKSQLILFVSIVVGILLIPFVAMQFTNQVRWTFMDFLVMAILLVALGISILWIRSRVKDQTSKKITWAIAILIFLLIWAELAVGILGTPFAGS